MALPGVAHAEKWTFSASAGATETYNHYFGANQPNDGFVTSLTAALAVRGEGARLKLSGTVSATEVLYTGQTQNNSFAPAASLAANLEAIEKFFYVDATASVTQTYISPFGPQPASLTTPTNNRYTSETYSVSPYIKGMIAPNIFYSVRDDNIWTTSTSFGDSSAKTPTTYGNNLAAQMNSAVGYWGWSLVYNRQSYDSGIEGGRDTLENGEASVSYQVDPQLSLSVRGGYERDRFARAPVEQGITYGAGANWRPTERTAVSGSWEHHFFGSSYSVQVSHRLPNVALSANLSRGLTNFPLLSLTVPAGVAVAQFLDAAFTTRIPDPVQRAQAVAQFLAQSGLPPTLVSPLNFYTAQISLQQTASVSAVWVGALNSVGVTVFRAKNEAIEDAPPGLPSDLQFTANNIQTGAAASYSHRLSGLTNLVASASYVRTIPNGGDDSANSGRSSNFNASLGLSTQFTPKTTGSAGVSYFVFDSSGGNTANLSTVSVYATISHTF
jgi:uncharacterized protein (PEP-CTERM system associated)